MGKKLFYLILAVIVLVGLYYVIGPSKQAEKGPTPGDDLPIEEEYENKIVYTTDTDLDAGPFEADCEAREGVFSECGTTCAPDADMCAQVCAYTCDLSGNVEDNSTSTEEDVTPTEEGTSTDME
ncbi:MAG TPA: hypothetical protein VKO61_00560 [Candidatus Paceibacterota bacterium]|nr:hypothetical protein [Candidatus Paceibacterota bacterium]